MAHEKMLDIIDYKIIATEEETMDAYTTFFNMFGVTVCNPDGTYKSTYDILKEASENINK